MKKFLFLYTVLLFCHYSNSQIFQGQVISLETHGPIGYSSIGVLHKNEGTVTDYDGNFSFDISQFSDEDTLRISATGYENIDFLIEHCKAYFISEAPIIIELVENAKTLEEVTIIAGRKKLLTSGNNVKPSMIIAGFQNRSLGAEMGTLIKYNKKRKGHIKSLNFNIIYNAADSVKFRVNLYDMKDGVPNKNILSEPIYFYDKPANGKITIDVSAQNIYIKDDTFLSIELIEDVGLEGMFFKSALLKSKSFFRDAPEGEWTKAAVDLGFWVEIYYTK